MRDIFLALQHIAQSYGIRQIAEYLGTKPEGLRKKLNPNDDSHQVTLAEFLHISSITGKPDALLAIAAELGYVCIKAHKATNETSMAQMCFLTMMLELGQSKGDLSGAIKSGMSDNRICMRDARDIKAAVYEMQCDLAQIEQAIDECFNNEKQGSRK
ncbi:phage regulatory CII family protein [Alkanindiges illinoisensis]|uniref:phage regulatory CII family protein n=1 Tax=Alkanindiges illinoisensis TaxID=197183 RepID=UPI00047B9630|nr:phage regulatory CII family protein [Alkanindiges illinoisensis]